MTLRRSKAVIIKDASNALAEIKGDNNLTFYQQQFLEYMLSLEDLPNTITELITNGDVTKQSFYSWAKELHFMTAFSKVCDCKDALVRPWVDKSNQEQAIKGNIGAQRTYYLRRGLLGQGNAPLAAVQINFGTEDKVAW